MERLTHPRCSGIKEGYWSPETKEKLVQRLAQYENTGLTPEEVREMAQEAEAQRQLSRSGERFQTFNPD